jgi:phosphatidylglycerophosphatase A
MRTLSSSLAGNRVSTADVRRAFRDSPVATFLSTGLGTGLSPFAPGTAGSALGLAAAWFLARALSTTSPSMTAAVGLLMSGLLVGLVGVPLSTTTARALGAKDPGCIVIDEISGQILASAAVPLFRYPTLRVEALFWLASFFLFRLFDVWKPGLIERLQDLPEGWGIVLDDVVAGLLAAGCVAAGASLLGFWP